MHKSVSQEDKQAIAQMEDTIDLNFGLGLWIRKNWIYPQSSEDVEALLKQFDDEADGDMPLFVHPDDYSSMILDAYQEYLKQKR